jgi:excisionase family DNA binding protein
MHVCVLPSHRGPMSAESLGLRNLIVQHLQQLALDSAPAISYGHVMKQVLNASEMARLLKVDRATVTRWIKQGKFRGVQRPPGAQNWCIPIAAYEEFIKHRR